MIADGRGRAIGFRIAPGQAHELPHAIPLLDRLPSVPKWVVGDRGYSSHSFRDHIWTIGARPAIPTKRNEAPLACPDWIYNNRNIVERLWARLKEWRAALQVPLSTARRGTHSRPLECSAGRRSPSCDGGKRLGWSQKVWPLV